jgi:hypothetical protein
MDFFGRLKIFFVLVTPLLPCLLVLSPLDLFGVDADLLAGFGFPFFFAFGLVLGAI